MSSTNSLIPLQINTMTINSNIKVALLKIWSKSMASLIPTLTNPNLSQISTLLIRKALRIS